MKKNNKFNKFGRNNIPDKYIVCACGSKSKLRSRKNYPFGKKSSAVLSQYYECEKCGKKTFSITNRKGGSGK